MKRVCAVLLTSALLLTMLAGCGNEEPEVEEEPDTGVAVEVEPVSRSNISTENHISGSVVAEKTESVFVSLSARCTNVLVEEGDTVKAGDVICILVLGTYRDNYEMASLNYESAQQSYQDQSMVLDQQIAQAEKNYHDTAALFEIGAASQLEVDSAKLTWDSAKASRNTALYQLEIAMKSAQTSMNQITESLQNVDINGNVRAPISGSVVSLSVAKDGYVSAGMSLAVVSSISDMKVAVSVSEAIISKLWVGAEASVTIGALDVTFPSTIQDIAQTADPMTHLYAVSIGIPEDQAGLLNGMFADVKLYTDSKEDVVVIPTEAISVDVQGEYVVILDDEGRAQQVYVQTGLVGDGVTEITVGLSGGETLVTVGQSFLAEGDLARVVSTEE